MYNLQCPPLSPVGFGNGTLEIFPLCEINTSIYVHMNECMSVFAAQYSFIHLTGLYENDGKT